jgi:purine catabolism regulator
LLRLLAPLQARQGVVADLSLVVPADEYGPAEASSRPDGSVGLLRAALEQVAPLFALALARRHDLASVEQRLRTDALDALLTGTYPDEEQMLARAVQLGYALERPHAVLVVELEPRSGARMPRPTLSPTAVQVAGVLGSALPGTWARAHGNEVAALVPLPEPATPGALAALALRLAALVAGGPGAPGGEWAAGLGEAALGPAQARRSYAEARDAARLGLAVLGPRQVARMVDLGIYRLLLLLRESGELDAFCQRTLGPLLADSRAGEVLLETLEVFFACNGNLSEAARQLDLHRNSLIYRLSRARDLLGQDLEDPELRLALQLALKARRVLAL